MSARSGSIKGSYEGFDAQVARFFVVQLFDVSGREVIVVLCGGLCDAFVIVVQPFGEKRREIAPQFGCDFHNTVADAVEFEACSHGWSVSAF